MFFSLPVRKTLLLLLFFLPPALTIAAESPDDLLKQAHEAWTKGDLATLARAREALKTDPLSDFVTYWWMDVQLDQPGPVNNAVMASFFAQYPQSPMRHALRVHWLKVLGRNADWNTFAAQMRPDVTSNATVVCYDLQRRLIHPDADTVREVRAFWFSQRFDRDACDAPFRLAVSFNHITHDDLWSALHEALNANRIDLARYINSYLPPFEGLDEEKLRKAEVRPASILDEWNPQHATQAREELTLFALERLAAHDPAQAAQYWEHLETDFSPTERSHKWAQIALDGARSGMSESLQWFNHVSEPILDNEEMEWRIRAALRAARWEDALRFIGDLPPEESGRSTWHYWKARALQTLGRSDEARTEWQSLAQQWDFYGMLAHEALGQEFVLPVALPPASSEMMRRLQPRLDRALRLHRLGFEPEAALEWSSVFHTLSPEEQSTAGFLASDAGWYDRAIDSVVRGGPQLPPNVELRYPLPYQSDVQANASLYHVDPAWLYALVRQESWFSPVARSSTGARGLMQLMPATASWVAHRIDLENYTNDQITDPATNLKLGSFYLSHLIILLGDPILATAAYNSGPNRVRHWLTTAPKEGDLFIETIPVNETRNYVENILFNTVIYEKRLKLPTHSLRQRLSRLSEKLPPSPASPTSISP